VPLVAPYRCLLALTGREGSDVGASPARRTTGSRSGGAAYWRDIWWAGRGGAQSAHGIRAACVGDAGGSSSLQPYTAGGWGGGPAGGEPGWSGRCTTGLPLEGRTRTAGLGGTPVGSGRRTHKFAKKRAGGSCRPAVQAARRAASTSCAGWCSGRPERPAVWPKSPRGS